MLKKIKEEYKLFKFSDGRERFFEWYLKRSAKDSTKFILSWLLVAFGVWLILDIRRVLVMFAIAIVFYIVVVLLEFLGRKKY